MPGLRKRIPLPYDTVLAMLPAALRSEGFGVLTDIDVRQTLHQKLGVSFRPYKILGACNPPLADRALHAELEIGLLLPCNVIVYEVSADRSAVSAMAPVAALGLVGDNRELQAVAAEADQRLRGRPPRSFPLFRKVHAGGQARLATHRVALGRGRHGHASGSGLVVTRVARVTTRAGGPGEELSKGRPRDVGRARRRADVAVVDR